MIRQFQDEIETLKKQLQMAGMGGMSGVVIGNDGQLIVEKIIKIQDEARMKQMEEKLE